MASYLVLFKYDEDGVVIDSMLDVTMLVGRGTLMEIKTAERVAQRLGATQDNSVDATVRNAALLGLRSRLDGACDGPYIIHTENDVSIDTLEQALRNDKKLLKRVKQQRANL